MKFAQTGTFLRKDVNFIEGRNVFRLYHEFDGGECIRYSIHEQPLVVAFALTAEALSAHAAAQRVRESERKSKEAERKRQVLKKKSRK